MSRKTEPISIGASSFLSISERGLQIDIADLRLGLVSLALLGSLAGAGRAKAGPETSPTSTSVPIFTSSPAVKQAGSWQEYSSYFNLQSHGHTRGDPPAGGLLAGSVKPANSSLMIGIEQKQELNSKPASPQESSTENFTNKESEASSDRPFEVIIWCDGTRLGLLCLAVYLKGRKQEAFTKNPQVESEEPLAKEETGQQSPVVTTTTQASSLLRSANTTLEARETTLVERLGQVIRENPDRFDQLTIARVRRFIQSETEESTRRKPWRLFKTVDDFLLYHRLHPEWQERSPKKMRQDKQSDGYNFFQAFNRYCTNVARGKKERDAMIQQIIPRLYRDWSSFTTIEDWIRECETHPEWDGKSTYEAQNDMESGLNAFFLAFKKWIRNVTDDEEERKLLYHQIFKPRYRDWSSFTTIEDWEAEYEQHSEWHGNLQNHSTGAYAFYLAFFKWVKRTAKSEEQRRATTKRVLKQNYSDWVFHTTIEDWIRECEAHPEWHGKSTAEMQRDTQHGGQAFYSAFNKWVRSKTGDAQERRTLMRYVFEPKYEDRRHLATIEDWIAEYKRHPDWHGKSPREMSQDRVTGASAFYAAFTNWARQTAENEEDRLNLIRKIFPESKPPYSYRFDEETVYFDSRPERIVAILLYKYGLIARFREGDNLHVLINERTRHSIDFRIGNSFI